jgi:hypothetical protein
VSRTTIVDYLTALEATFVVHVLRPFSTRRPREIVSAPKVYASPGCHRIGHPGDGASTTLTPRSPRAASRIGVEGRGPYMIGAVTQYLTPEIRLHGDVCSKERWHHRGHSHATLTWISPADRMRPAARRSGVNPAA